MKILFKGNLTVEEFGTLIGQTIQDFLDKVEADSDTVKLNNPIVQTAFQIEGMEEAVFLTTEHGEMLQVEVETENGEIVNTGDNQEEPTEDKRLWSYDRLASHTTEAPTEQIESKYRPKELEYVSEYHVTDSIVQVVYNIIGTEEQLIRYVNVDLEGEGIVAEEVVAKKGEEQ